MNEPQWIGLIVTPINYSLRGASLHIDTGPGLKIEDSHAIEMENHSKVLQNTARTGNSDDSKNESSSVSEEFAQLMLKDGKIELPDWSSNSASVLWFPVRATDSRSADGISSG